MPAVTLLISVGQSWEGHRAPTRAGAGKGAETRPAASLTHLPQFEGIWADALMEATDYQQETVFASLLAHYGTGDALAIIREKAESKTGEWACAPQGAALGYLVKFDPVSARPLVERALQARGSGKSACNHSIFQDIAHYSHDPMLRQVAIQALDDPDPEVIMDALIYLMSYGAVVALH